MKLLDKIFPKKAVQKDEQESIEYKKGIKETLQEKKEQMKFVVKAPSLIPILEIFLPSMML